MSEKKPKTIDDPIESTRLYHERYLRAINNPLRRNILRILKEGSLSIEELLSKTGLEIEALKWHLSILEHGSCVEKKTESGKPVYRLTQEGRVVDYMQ